MNEQTTETRFGPAFYTVTDDGLLCLRWPDSVTINRVEYNHANAFQARSSGSQTVFAHVYLNRACGIASPSLAAVDAVRAELASLAPGLCTPLASACTALEQAERRAKDAARQLVQAQEADARARAWAEDARAKLARLQVEQEGAAE